MATKKKRIDFTQEPPEHIADCPFYGYQLDDDQLKFAEAIYSKDIDIVFCNAPAGTGKDLVALGTANLMVQFGMYDEIVYIVSPYGERKQGYLPGDLQTKSQIYYEPAYQTVVALGLNPNVVINLDGLCGDKNGGYITCVTDTYLRGTNITDRKILLLDECQNFDFNQLKKTLTRVGKDTKVLCIGHDGQIDLDRPEKSGFVRYIEHFTGLERAAICELKTNHRSWISQHADALQE